MKITPAQAADLSVASYAGTIPDGWRKVGDLTAKDALLLEQVLGLGDRVWYGYVLVSNADPLQFVFAIRGTEGAEEWFEDCRGLLMPGPAKGMGEQGFWGIFESMEFLLPGAAGVPMAQGIAAVLPPGAHIDGIGHSLGSTLTTYGVTELAAMTRNFTVGGVMLASPRPGDTRYAAYVDETVGNLNYIVCNYLRDVVPRTPITLPFMPFAPLPHVMTIRPSDSTAVIPDNVKSNHQVTSYAALLSNWRTQ